MNLSIQRILLPTDFSDCSRDAQRYACALAAKFTADVHVLHVVTDPSPLPSVTGLTIGPAKDLLPQIVRHAEERLAAQVAEDIKGYPLIRYAVRVGDPVPVIKDYADTHDIDLIVIGTHGHQGLSHVLIGSVAEKLIRLAKCPVLSVHAVGSNGSKLLPAKSAK